jgi:antitoxin ParD1/3/4
MNINLTPELEKLVHEKVGAGLYRSRSEVVREALRLLIERDSMRQARLTRVLSEPPEGSARANGEDLPDSAEEARGPKRPLRARRKSRKA